MRRVAWIAAVITLAGCSGEADPEPTDMGGGSLDQFIIDPADDMPVRSWTSVRIDDDTPVGQGLPLDHVEVCNPLGMACVALVLESSSDDALDYAGATDGPNSQDDTCTDTTFTRLGGTGNSAVFATADGEPIATGSQLNVWTADSACALVEAGDKAFTVSVVDDAGEDGTSEGCAGTCTVTVRSR